MLTNSFHHYSTLEYCILSCQHIGSSCKAIQYNESSWECTMGEIKEDPTRSKKELGAFLTYSREKVLTGNDIVIF